MRRAKVAEGAGFSSMFYTCFKKSMARANHLVNVKKLTSDHYIVFRLQVRNNIETWEYQKLQAPVIGCFLRCHKNKVNIKYEFEENRVNILPGVAVKSCLFEILFKSSVHHEIDRMFIIFKLYAVYMQGIRKKNQ